MISVLSFSRGVNSTYSLLSEAIMILFQWS